MTRTHKNTAESSWDSEDKATPSDGRVDSAFRTAFWASLIVLAFIAGALVTLLEIFPGPQIAGAYQGGRALYEKVVTRQDVFGTDLWRRERSPARGVTRYDAGRAQDGVTLYTSGHAPSAFLMGMDGTILHEWRKPFSEVWNPMAPEAWPKTPQPDSFVYFRKAHLFRNGDLIAIYEAAGDTPYGYGVVKLDKSSNVIWPISPPLTTILMSRRMAASICSLKRSCRTSLLSAIWQRHGLRTFSWCCNLTAKRKPRRLANVVAKSPWRHPLNMVSAYATADPLHTNTVKMRFASGSGHSRRDHARRVS